MPKYEYRRLQITLRVQYDAQGTPRTRDRENLWKLSISDSGAEPTEIEQREDESYQAFEAHEEACFIEYLNQLGSAGWAVVSHTTRPVGGSSAYSWAGPPEGVYLLMREVPNTRGRSAYSSR